MAVGSRTVEGRDDENALPVLGRPDFANRNFGVTHAKKFPPYVYSTRRHGCLVHKIARVELHWYRVGGNGSELVRLKKPAAIARTVCNVSFWLESRYRKTCVVPKDDAVLCGRCHGEPYTFSEFGAGTKAGITRKQAHEKLGCAVNGY